MLPRELYVPPPEQDEAVWINTSYADNSLTREERFTTSSASDVYLHHQRRISADNGRTWSDLEPIKDMVAQTPQGGIAAYLCAHTVDRKRGAVYQPLMRRLWPGMKAYTMPWDKAYKTPLIDHTFVIENAGTQRMMKYEEGPDFDPENPFDPAFCKTNRAYYGSGMAIGDDSAVFFPLSCITSNGRNEDRQCIVLMRRDPVGGDWRTSNQQYISPDLSSRGLLEEPDAAILRNGNILVVCRGHNTVATPGRKWMLLSTDGGRTLGPVDEFRYDDGSSFYSPSSIHRFVRSSKTGRLYWIANILPRPPEGGRPRYPLQICEIDEDIPAVKKGTLCVIDNRRENEPELIQLSNFSVIENRETLDMEIYLSRLGEDPKRPMRSGVYRYIYTP
ncbi:MAG: hypothetical protein PHW60_11635 [Kiritimatiellae bacterium]|nr:hypothetical protein [Kiritimatiellia bacterium]